MLRGVGPWLGSSRQRLLGVLCLASLGAAGLAACEVGDVYVGVKGREPSSCDADCYVDPSVSEAERGPLDAELEPTLGAPEWAYPLAGSMLIRNLADVSLQFRREPGQVAFRLDVHADGLERRLYVPCLALADMTECTYQVPLAFWQELSLALSGKVVKLELRGTDGRGVSAPATLEVEFSPADVRGGLYYWSSQRPVKADAETNFLSGGLWRVTFGGRLAVPYVQTNGTDLSAPDACIGCHAVSRDGSVVAFTSGKAEEGDVAGNAAFVGRLTVTDAERPTATYLETPADAPSDSGMIALDSHGTRVITAFDNAFVLRDARTGEELDRIEPRSLPGDRSPYFPEFSPDDKRVALTIASRVDSEIAVASGSIAVIDMDGDKFGALHELVPDSQEAGYHYYPTWSPDGRWIAFVSAPANATKSYDQAQSVLKLVSAEGGAVVALNKATKPLGSTTTWPKFSPFFQCPDGSQDCAVDERIFFLTVSSKRDYGFLLRNSTNPLQLAQLWMSAIELSRLAVSGSDALADPSLPPLWIPYQDIDTRNHLGFWTEVVRCGIDVPCGTSEGCVDHVCTVK
jgi:hypothetical protein